MKQIKNEKICKINEGIVETIIRAQLVKHQNLAVWFIGEID